MNGKESKLERFESLNQEFSQFVLPVDGYTNNSKAVDQGIEAAKNAGEQVEKIVEIVKAGQPFRWRDHRLDLDEFSVCGNLKNVKISDILKDIK